MNNNFCCKDVVIEIVLEARLGETGLAPAVSKHDVQCDMQGFPPA